MDNFAAVHLQIYINQKATSTGYTRLTVIYSLLRKNNCTLRHSRLRRRAA